MRTSPPLQLHRVINTQTVSAICLQTESERFGRFFDLQLRDPEVDGIPDCGDDGKKEGDLEDGSCEGPCQEESDDGEHETESRNQREEIGTVQVQGKSVGAVAGEVTSCICDRPQADDAQSDCERTISARKLFMRNAGS